MANKCKVQRTKLVPIEGGFKKGHRYICLASRLQGGDYGTNLLRRIKGGVIFTATETHELWCDGVKVHLNKEDMIDVTMFVSDCKEVVELWERR